MKRIATRAAMAALALGMTGIAQAIPIQFDFSGTTYDGTRGSGQFIIETDGLVQLAFGGPDFPQKTFTDLLGIQNRPTPMVGSFSINSTTYDLGSYLPGGYGGISFVDVCRPDCMPFARENWNIQVYQQDAPYGGPLPAAGYTYQSLSFTSGTPFSFEHPESFDFLDNSVTRPEDILTLPLLQLSANFYEESYDCTSGQCVSHRTFEYQLVIDTVTRSVISTSVPEPGSLGLLGAALFGMLLHRRRVISAPIR